MAATNAKTIDLPKGWFIAKDGRPMAKENMTAIEKSRHELATKAVKLAASMRQDMEMFRGLIDALFDKHIDFVFAEKGKKPGGKDGGLSVVSMDGLNKIVRRVGGTMKFTEELQVSEQIVMEFVRKQPGSKVLKEIAYSAFKTSSEGHYDQKRLADLFDRDYKDEEWMKAKKIYQDSRYYEGKKPYLAFATRDNLEDEWTYIPLNLAQIVGISPSAAAGGDDG